jgi:hypothetical protein
MNTNSKHLKEENHQLKEGNTRLLKKYNEKSQIKPVKYDSGLGIFAGHPRRSQK